MKVKIDTKEKFSVLTINEPILSANMTEVIKKLLLAFLDNNPKSVVIKLAEVNKIGDDVVSAIIDIQQKFYEHKASFVMCEANNEVKQSINKPDFLDQFNITNTESEAWDIVQMEEIERELMA